MPTVFMSHPSQVLMQYLASGERMGKMTAYQAGKLSVALELLTQIKILHSMPLTEDSASLEGALQGFLVDQGLMDDAERWYERLDAWRTPTFVREASAPAGVSSARATHEGALSRTRRIRAWHEARRGQDESSTSATEPHHDAAM